MELLERFVASFRKAIRGEMEAMRERLGSFEVPIGAGRELEDAEGSAGRKLYAFEIAAPNDKLVVHAECTFSAADDEKLVTIEALDGREITLSCHSKLPTREPAMLVIYPWFLYERLLAALESLLESADHHVDSALMAFGKHTPTLSANALHLDHDDLNNSQRRAVQLCSNSSCAFVWGPPGTGKTTTLGHIVSELMTQDYRILITSTTNAAVDQALAKLAELPAAAKAIERGEVLRIGQTDAPTFGADLHAVVRRLNADTQAQIDALRERRDVCQSLITKCSRILEQIGNAGNSVQLDLFRTVASSGLQERDLKPVFSAAMRAHTLTQGRTGQHDIVNRRSARLANVRALSWQRIRKLQRELRGREPEIARSAQVVLATMTNTTISRLLENQRFDVVIVEEAGMAILPSLFYCASLAREKVIIVGDPKQLPPIVQSRDDYVYRAMGRNIFDVTVPNPAASELVAMLDTQYRMHPAIGDLVSRLFYNCGLRNGENTPEREQIAARKPYPGTAVVVLDTARTTVCAVQPGGFSRLNERTAELCVKLAKEALADGIASIAIITPYTEQSRLIRRLLGEAGMDTDAVECRTVHRFQGNERDMVILDTVDTAPLPPGVLLTGSSPRSAAPNLINVSISRARGKLAIVADVPYFAGRCPNSVMVRMLQAAAEAGKTVTTG